MRWEIVFKMYEQFLEWNMPENKRVTHDSVFLCFEVVSLLVLHEFIVYSHIFHRFVSLVLHDGCLIASEVVLRILAHLLLDKMTVISQKIFSDAFS